jgi:uncharacterized phage-associated protein
MVQPKHQDTKDNNVERLHFNFNYKKSTQALNYFALKEGGQINKMKVLKLIYFADRYHLRKYGRLITNDNYVAMKHGPVPSITKDIAESNDFLDEIPKDYSLKFIEPIDNRVLKTVGKIDKNVFSESDLEALQFAWDVFGHFNQFELRDLTHLYPEWLRHKDTITIESWSAMLLLDFLKDPIKDANKCFELSAEDKDIRREQIIELAHIESLWR